VKMCVNVFKMPKRLLEMPYQTGPKFIIHHSVFITHNSKLVGSTEKKFVWLCFQVSFPSLNSLFFSDGLWKLKTSFKCFQVMEIELWWHFSNFTQLIGQRSVYSHFNANLCSPNGSLHTRPNSFPFH